MAFIRSWTKRSLFTSLKGSTLTATGDVTTQPTLLYYIVCTHTGAAKAVVELFDNGTGGTKQLHLESASGDVSPFGFSTNIPLLFENKMTLAFTATGANVSVGYFDYIT